MRHKKKNYQRATFAFTGDIASLAGPDGAHFMGEGNPNIVIGFDSTGTHDIGRDIPLDPNSTPSRTIRRDLPCRRRGRRAVPSAVFDERLTMVTPQAWSNRRFRQRLSSTSWRAHRPTTSLFTFDPANKYSRQPASPCATCKQRPRHRCLYVRLRRRSFNEIRGIARPILTIDITPQSRAADPQVILIHLRQSSHRLRLVPYASATSYLVSGDQLDVTKYFPETFVTTAVPLPAVLHRLRIHPMGRVGHAREFGNDGNPEFVDDVNLGWWVAGDITDSRLSRRLMRTRPTRACHRQCRQSAKSGWNDLRRGRQPEHELELRQSERRPRHQQFR